MAEARSSGGLSAATGGSAELRERRSRAFEVDSVQQVDVGSPLVFLWDDVAPSARESHRRSPALRTDSENVLHAVRAELVPMVHVDRDPVVVIDLP